MGCESCGVVRFDLRPISLFLSTCQHLFSSFTLLPPPRRLCFRLGLFVSLWVCEFVCAFVCE